MESDPNVRIVQFYNSKIKEWFTVRPSQIKKGNSFRMFEPDGTPLTNWDESTYFVATKDSEMNEDGVYVTECVWNSPKVRWKEKTQNESWGVPLKYINTEDNSSAYSYKEQYKSNVEPSRINETETPRFEGGIVSGEINFKVGKEEGFMFNEEHTKQLKKLLGIKDND